MSSDSGTGVHIIMKEEKYIGGKQKQKDQNIQEMNMSYGSTRDSLLFMKSHSSCIPPILIT